MNVVHNVSQNTGRRIIKVILQSVENTFLVYLFIIRSEKMPKVIKALRQKIIDKSELLFITYSYEKVDMRKIAKELEIAVGTLYNYFPNKWDLYVECIKSSWINTIRNLNEIVESENDDEEKLFLYIETLYSEMSEKKVLSKDLVLQQMRKNKIPKDCFTENPLKDTVIKQIQTIVNNKYKIELDENESNNITKVIFGLIVTRIHDLDKKQTLEKVQFVFDVVDSYIIMKMMNN